MNFKNIKAIILILSAIFLISGFAFAEKAKKDPAAKAEKQHKKAEKAAKTDKEDKEEKEDKGVSFSNLKNGQKVKSPLKVKMAVSGKKVAPAGDPAPETGHFHIIIDGDHVEKGKLVPADAKHIHYGLGQTEAELNLDKGKHTLTLQFADKDHLSFGKKWAKTINILVE